MATVLSPQHLQISPMKALGRTLSELTCHWPFMQPRPEPGGHLRLLAQVEQSLGARNAHRVQRAGRLRWSGAGRSLQGFGI